MIEQAFVSQSWNPNISISKLLHLWESHAFLVMMVMNHEAQGLPEKDDFHKVENFDRIKLEISLALLMC